MLCLSFDRASEVLDYNAESGVLRWKVATAAKIRVGDIAGSTGADGYIRVRIDTKRYAAHRVAWLIHTGKHPLGVIDHINGDRSDNRAENLRDTCHVVNMQNQRRPCAGKTDGLPLGVSRITWGWSARIKVFGKRIWLGTFRSVEEASAAYIAAKRQLHVGGRL